MSELHKALELLAEKWDSADYAIAEVNNPLLPQEQCAIELRAALAAKTPEQAADPICNYRVERWIGGVNHSWNCKRVFGHSGQHYSSPGPEDFGTSSPAPATSGDK